MASINHEGGGRFSLKRQLKRGFDCCCGSAAARASPDPQEDHPTGSSPTPNSDPLLPAHVQPSQAISSSSLEGRPEIPVDELHADTLNPAVEHKSYHIQEITVDDLDILLGHIEAELQCLHPVNPTKSSSNLISSMSSQCQQHKEIASSFVQTLPKALTQEIVGASESVMMPLLKKALGGLGGVHWVGLGLSFIAWSLDNIDLTSQNHENFLKILQQVVFLLSNTRKLLHQEAIHEDHHHMQDLQENVELALQCVIIGTSSLRGAYLYRFLKASSAEQAIAKLDSQLSKALSKNTSMGMEVVLDNMPKPHHQIIFQLDDKKIGVFNLVSPSQFGKDLTHTLSVSTAA